MVSNGGCDGPLGELRGNWVAWVDSWGQLGGLMGSNEGCGGPLGELGVNWAICEAMPPRHPKAHLGHHGFTNPPICFS